MEVQSGKIAQDQKRKGNKDIDKENGETKKKSKKEDSVTIQSKNRYSNVFRPRNNRGLASESTK
jgi:hypothetical protein